MPKWINTASWPGLVLVAMDVALLYLVIGLVHYVRLGFWPERFEWQLGAIIAVTVSSLYIMNVYHLDRLGKPVRTALRAFTAVAVSGGLIAAVVYVTKSTDVSTVLWRGNLPLALFLFACLAALLRYLGQLALRRFTSEPLWLVLGASERAASLDEDHRRALASGRLVHLVTDDERLARLRIEPRAGEVVVTDGDAVLFAGRAAGIVLAADGAWPESLVSGLMRVRLGGVPILELADYYEQFLLRVPVMQLKDGWFAMSDGFALLHHDIQMKIKRLVDIVVSLLGLVLAFPFLVATALVVRLTSKGPAIYSQTRTGCGGREFRLHKFRTMVDNAERNGPQWTAEGDPRITAVGQVLRRTRIDELPQLWNVLVGHMSFIGPRPERPDFNRTLEAEIPYYDLRHLVKPGITGWAQVMYSYGASVNDARNKLEYDLYYIKNYSLALDIYITLRTLRVVFSWAGR